MKVAGFTFIRNARQFDFPVVEAITSVLPLCDAFFVAVGNSADDTLQLVKSIPTRKIVTIETVWDDSLTEGGSVYARETDKAFDAIPDEYEWCFYIQGDEVLHEKYLEEVRSAMLQWWSHPEVEGLLFSYRHFYGTYDYVGDSRHWYRKEVRIIRNDKSIRSYRDAQGFRKAGRKIKAVAVNAEIFHYGWVRHPLHMQRKIDAVQQYYGGLTSNEAANRTMQLDFRRADSPLLCGGEFQFDYSKNYDALTRFTGSHLAVMKERIQKLNWNVTPDLSRKNMTLRYRVLHWFEKMTGIRPFEFRNYTLVKRSRFSGFPKSYQKGE